MNRNKWDSEQLLDNRESRKQARGNTSLGECRQVNVAPICIIILLTDGCSLKRYVDRSMLSYMLEINSIIYSILHKYQSQCELFLYSRPAFSLALPSSIDPSSYSLMTFSHPPNAIINVSSTPISTSFRPSVGKRTHGV